MSRALAWAACLVGGSSADPRQAAAADCVEVSARAVDLVDSTTVVDMLGLLTLDWRKLWRWQHDPAAFTLADFRALEATGVDMLHPAVETASADPHAAAQRWLAGWSDLIDSQSCYLGRVEGVSDLARVPARGTIGLLLGFQNSNHFRSDADVAEFARRGQRVSQLTYNGRNRLGCGCMVVRDTGLTGFGAAVVEAMNAVGMVVDVSHCGDRTTLDAIAASRFPVLATHADCRALVPGQPRNKPDEVIRRLAAAGGVIGINLVGAFVARHSPSLDDVLDHIDHVARLVGIEHVGLGTDVAADALDSHSLRSRAPYAIDGLQPRWRVYQLVDGMLGRGYGEHDIRQVLGGNFLRALGDIWRAGEWQPQPGGSLDRDPFCPAPMSGRRALPRCGE